MSEEKTEVALVSLPATPAELEAAFINDEYIDGLITSIREKALPVVGDLNKAAGRRVYISMAATVRSTKAMIDEAGKNLVADMKKRPALVDASRKKVRDALDDLAVEIRKPVTDWEAEQDRLKAEKQMIAWHVEALEMNDAFDKARAERIEADHEIALLMNEKHDRDIAEAKAEAGRQRIAHEEELKRQAAENAKREAEQKSKAELEASAKREADLKAAAELAERQRVEAEAKAAREKQEAAREKQEAAEQAERDKQAAIEAEQLRAKQEADRIRLEAEQKEQARLAEEKRIADEAAKRAKDTEHRRTVNRTAVADLINEGIPDEFARKCVEAVARMKIKNMTINY